MNNKEKGEIGEKIACQYYESLDYEIVEKNYRFGKCEIDLIAMKEEFELVFVEVKMRNTQNFGFAESFVSVSQQERIKEAAEDYIFAINWKKSIRFDILCVDSKKRIEVFKDAF